VHVLSSALLAAKKSRSKGRQTHPTGPLETVDESWKDDLRAEMRRRGWTQKDLAEKIPAAPASITNLFKAGPRQIRFKHRIEELCGWSQKTPREKELIEQISRRAAQLPLEAIEQVAGLVDLLANKR
jgi:ribosome-binding protein aMBF1 (putative translation factor)